MDIEIIVIVLPIWVVAEVVIVCWMFKAKPDKHLHIKYSRKIILLSQLPFGIKWKKNVHSDDLNKMVTYQHRIIIWYLSVIIPFILFYIYLYFD